MTEKEFFEKVIGVVTPWVIVKIEIDEAKKRVDIHLDYLKEKGKCPLCKKSAPIYDEREMRVWRHRDTCLYQTYLHCRIPRTNCPEHGIKTMEVPWAADKIRFTKQFECHAINLVQATKNRSRSAELLKISWDEINGIMGRAVERGLKKRAHEKIKNLGIDEKSFLKGQNYVTILTDTDGKRVLDVVQNRDIEAVKKLFKCLNEEQLINVKAISMDFWQAFINAAKELLGNACIVHDKFHIMKYAKAAVNKVRITEHRWQKKEKESVLTGTKWLWLKKLQNFTDKEKKKWAALNLDILEVGKAWQLRELLNEFWNCPNTASARKFFKFWCKKVKRSGLEPVKKLAEMINKFFENIITWWKHPITNSFAEGINSVIQEIKTVARGFRNFENYRTAILFFCGKLELYP